MAQRISIGFQGGQVLALRVSRRGARPPQDALGGEGWHEITAEDGTVQLNLEQVLWVRTESDEHRVGFGIGGR